MKVPFNLQHSQQEKAREIAESRSRLRSVRAAASGTESLIF